MFKTGPLFEANYNSKADIVINQGGTSSGKTYAILQTLFAQLSEEDKKVCTVVGQDIPNLKAGALRDALEIYASSTMLHKLIDSYNKTDRIFYFNNGSIMEFKSYDSVQDAKSGKRDKLFVNEANGIPYDVYEQLSLRTKEQEFLDYNPSSEFWAHELIGNANTEHLITDHRHNPFVQDKVRAKIEALKQKDEELWKVYARGMTGKIEGLVLRNWVIVDDIPTDAKFIGGGMDFGFTNDPTTYIRVYMQNGELWVSEGIYRTELTNDGISQALTDLGISKRDTIIADSAEPKSIKELSNFGFNIEGAQKGPDSILNSLDILKRYRINVTRSSTNLRKELMNYKWRVDKATGKTINEPVDAFNHAIDALRYVALNRLKAGSSSRPKTSLPS